MSGDPYCPAHGQSPCRCTPAQKEALNAIFPPTRWIPFVAADVFHCVHCDGFIVLAVGDDNDLMKGDRCPCGAEIYPVRGILKVGGGLYLNRKLPRESSTVSLGDPQCEELARACQTVTHHEDKLP